MRGRERGPKESLAQVHVEINKVSGQDGSYYVQQQNITSERQFHQQGCC